MNQRRNVPMGREAASWGFQKAARWATGEAGARNILTLELCMGASNFPGSSIEQPPNVPPHPVGLWRVQANVTQGNIAATATITYGAGGESKRITNVILPLVAYVPGYCQVDVTPNAGVTQELVVTGSAVPCMAYGLQQVGTLFDATVAPVVLPQTVFGLTAWAASTYTPTGAPAPIAIGAGATVDVAGQVTINTGVGVAWHEL